MGIQWVYETQCTGNGCRSQPRQDEIRDKCAMAEEVGLADNAFVLR